MHIKIINGANLNMLGVRNKNIYGCSNLQDINREIASKAREIGVVVSFFQSNDEGKIIDEIHNCIDNCDGIIINPRIIVIMPDIKKEVESVSLNITADSVKWELSI